MNKRWIALYVGLCSGFCFGQGMDLDGNGLADDWELSHFGVVGIDAQLDHDGDGRSALEEMLAGTDPNSATSRFSSVVSSEDAAVWVQFGPLRTNRAYAVERTADLETGTWLLLTNGTSAQWGTQALVEDDARSAGFYRIHTMPTALTATGRIFYVSNEGSDGNDGRSVERPWRTLAHVSEQSLLPGDSVLLHRGDTWRETFYLSPTATGVEGAWLTYGAYGAGEKPRILGSEAATNWSEVGVNIWRAADSFENPYGGGYSYAEVFFEEVDGRFSWGRQREYDASFSAMTAEHDWCWNEGRIYVYAPENPATHFQAVEVPQRDSCIAFPGVNGTTVTAENFPNYIAFDNLTVMYAMRRGIYGGYNEVPAEGLRVTYCHIGCIGVKGGASAYGLATWFSKARILYNVFHDCGRRAISYNTYTDYTPNLVIEDVVMSHNYFYNGYHTTGPDISSLPGLTHTYTHFTVSYNLLNDLAIDDYGEETSNGIYISAKGNDYSHFTIHHNVVLGSTARAILIQEVGECFIYHNSVYGSHPAADPYSLITFYDSGPIDFRNNIVYANLIDPPHAARCVMDEGTTSFSQRNHNLYFQLQDSQPFTGSENGYGGWDVFTDEWASWTAGSGFELASPVPQDPLYTNPEARNVHLLLGSVAIDAGAVIPGINDAYEGNAPDLGACESVFTGDDSDTEAPSVPAGLAGEGLSDTQIRVSWAAASDNVRVAGYRLYRDGTEVGYTTDTAFSDSGLRAETSYSYQVRAEDMAGNVSARSAAQVVSTLAAGATPETVTVTASSYENNGSLVNPPEQAVDGDLATRWSAEGVGEWIQWAFPTQQVFNTVSVAFYRGDLRVAAFEVESSADGVNWTTLLEGESEGETEGLEEFTFAVTTSHYFRVVGQGNSESDWNSYLEVEWAYVEPDVVAPSVPQQVRAVTNSFYSATVNWSASSDARGVAGYLIFRDGVAVGESSQLSFVDDGLSALTTYAFSVAAFDAAGNLSATSTAAAVTTGGMPAATTYYVSNEGDDADDGQTPETAWATIAQVNSETYNPGDQILFRRGDEWRGTLYARSSGVESAYITYGAYGSGERPRMMASEQATDWEAVPGYPNVWRSTTPLPNPFDYYGSEIWFVGSEGSVAWSVHSDYGYGDDFTALDSLTEEFEATWIGGSDYNADGSIYVWSPSNPATHYAAVEVPVWTSIFEIDDQEYIAIENLSMRYALARGVNENYSPSYTLRGLKILGCEIGFVGVKNGSNMYGLNVRHCNMLIASNEVHDCGRRAVSLVVYDTTPVMNIENITIEHNHFHSGFHTTGIDCNNTGSHTISNVVVRYNRFEGDPDTQLDNWYTTDEVEGDPNSNFMFVANQGNLGSYVGGMKIYGNIFSYAHASSVKLESVDDIEICNNTFYAFNPTLSNIQGHVYNSTIDFPLTHITIKNNIFYNNADTSSETPAQASIKWDFDMAPELTINNNLYYAPDGDDGWLFRVHYGTHYRVGDWADYLADNAFDAESPAPADPLFVDPANGDFRLQAGSPAIHAGAPIDGVSMDYAGTAFHASTPSLGALEVIE